MTQYDRCSSNSECACLYIAGTKSIGICAEQSLANCSELRPCQPLTNLCYEPNHKCVHHPRCHNQPVCYPIPSFNRELCPLIPVGTTTTSTPGQQIVIPNIPENATWTENGVTVAGGNGEGNSTNQFKSPFSVLVDDDETLLIVDGGNHRIIEWKKGETNGQVVFGNNVEGIPLGESYRPSNVVIDKETNSLIFCDWVYKRVVRWTRRSDRKLSEIMIRNIDCFGLAIDDYGYLYVTDIRKHEVRRYGRGDTTGTVVAGGNDKGDGLHQLDWATHVFVDREQNLYISEFGNARVVRWSNGAKQGIIVAGGHGEGNGLMQLQMPGAIAIDSSDTVYVADTDNHRIMRWPQGARQGTVIAGGNGSGEAANQLNAPFGLALDRNGNIYVAERDNHRIQKFSLA